MALEVEVLGQFVTVNYGSNAEAVAHVEDVRSALARPQYIVIVGPSSNDETTYTFGPLDAEAADEMGYQLEYALGQSDREIHVESLKRGLAEWFANPDPADETIVHIEP